MSWSSAGQLGGQLAKQPARPKKVLFFIVNIDVLGRDRHFRCRGAKVGVRNSAFSKEIASTIAPGMPRSSLADRENPMSVHIM